MSNNSEAMKLRMLLGDYPIALALKKGEVSSSRITIDFAAVKAPKVAFKRVVRDLEFEVAELAIATFLQAKAYGIPLVLLPVVVRGGKAQHATIVYNPERGHLNPADLAGRRIGIRSNTQTTVMWVRGILENDYGVALERVKWVAFEDPNVAAFHDPDTVERAASGKKLLTMLLDGEVDAAVLSGNDLKDPRVRPVIPEPEAAAQAWSERHKMSPINHMLVVKDSLSKSSPWAVQEVFRLMTESKKAAGLPASTLPFGLEANRKCLELAIKCAVQQRLIPRRLTVDELFDDVTRGLGK